MRLARASFPADESPPISDQYATWPEQARLLCAGELVQLRALQLELAKQLGEPVEANPEVRDERRFERDRPDLLWLLLMALLLLASLASYIAASRSQACDCEAPPPITRPPRARVTILPMSTDFLFDFNLRDSYSRVHEQRTLQALSVLFNQFDGITIKSIEAHTDPIGKTETNKKLANDRAQFIHDLVARVIADSKFRDRFKPGELPPPEPSDGPSSNDRAIWEECFNKFYRAVPDKPLSNLSDGSRPACSQPIAVTGEKVLYPACSRLTRTRSMSAAAYARSAENFRKLTACLAPMRHVLIKISYERRGYAEGIDIRSSEEEVAQ